MEIFIYIAGFIGGWLVHRQMMIYIIKKIDHVVDEASDSKSMPDQLHINCVAEKYQDQYLLYQHPDGKFLVQGTDLETMAAQVSQQYQRPVTLKILEITT